MRRHLTSPFDHEPDERLTFTDVTILTFLVVLVASLAVVFLLGTVSAEHRIAAVLALR